MFKTIAFSLILAWIALCCSILAVFYEYTAENNRYEAESRNSYQLRDNQLIYFRDREVIRSNVQHSEMHSEFFFKKNTKYLIESVVIIEGSNKKKDKYAKWHSLWASYTLKTPN